MKNSYFYLMLFVFSIQIVACSNSKMINITDSDYSFGIVNFEKEYQVNSQIDMLDVSIFYPDKTKMTDIDQGALLVILEKEDGKVVSILLDEVWNYYYSSQNKEYISRIGFKSILLKEDISINNIIIKVEKPFNSETPMVLSINNLKSGLLFDK